MIVFAIIGTMGIDMLRRVDLREHGNMFILAAALTMGLLPIVVPGLYSKFGPNLQILLGNGLAMGVLTAVLMNILFHHIGSQRSAESAPSANEPGAGTGRDVYLNRAKPFFPAPARVAAGYAAARRLAPRVDAARGGCYVAKQQTDRVLLTHCRTGRDYRFRVSVGREEGTGLSVDVAGPDGAAIAQLGLSDLPERYRFPIIAARRAELVRRGLAADEARLLATGARDLRHVAARALLRAVAALEHDRSPRAVAAVTDLADLLELEGAAIPFDVQTAFYRIRVASPPGRAAELAPLAWRLGFAEGD